MTPFKDITLAGRDIITALTMESDHRDCDLSFSNLCSWRSLYDTQSAVIDDFLVLKLRADEQLTYTVLIGSGDLKAVLRRLIEDVDKEKHNFCMLGVCNNMHVDPGAILPERFVFTRGCACADYIYLRSDLATLKGRKPQVRRNHINRFRNTYLDYEYIPAMPDHIQECLGLEAEWCKVNNCDQQEGTGDERCVFIYALHNLEVPGLIRGILHVNGKIMAFTFGIPIDHETFGVHIERADTSTDDAYAMINYELANHTPKRYTYINRERDLDIEDLCKVKLSYQPVTILERCTAYLKDHLMDMVRRQ